MSKTQLNLQDFDESMTLTQTMSWIRRQLNREPEGIDLYNAGKQLFQTGLYRGAVNILQQYVERQGAEPPGYHLLGYACSMIGDYERGIACLAKVANKGFDSDWQLLVEMRIEADREAEAREKERVKRLYYEPIRKEFEAEQDAATQALLARTIFSIELQEAKKSHIYKDTPSFLLPRLQQGSSSPTRNHLQHLPPSLTTDVSALANELPPPSTYLLTDASSSTSSTSSSSSSSSSSSERQQQHPSLTYGPS